MQYLQGEFKKNNYNLIDENNWSLKTICDVPQQENTEDCGIFVCLYCDFILNDCALDFTQDDIRNESGVKRWCCLFCQLIAMITMSPTLSCILKDLVLRLHLT